MFVAYSVLCLTSRNTSKLDILQLIQSHTRIVELAVGLTGILPSEISLQEVGSEEHIGVISFKLSVKTRNSETVLAILQECKVVLPMAISDPSLSSNTTFAVVKELHNSGHDSVEKSNGRNFSIKGR